MSYDLRLNHARFWLGELRESQHFSTFYGPSVQSMDIRLARGKGGGPRRSTEVMLDEQFLPVTSLKSRSSEDAMSATRAERRGPETRAERVLP